MFSIEGNVISITKGDNGVITVALDNHFLITGDDVVTMTVKKNIEDINYVIQKSTHEFIEGKAKIQLTELDTNIPPGKYVYDIQVNLGDGRVQTVITPSTFRIMKGVTD